MSIFTNSCTSIISHGTYCYCPIIFLLKFLTLNFRLATLRSLVFEKDITVSSLASRLEKFQFFIRRLSGLPRVLLYVLLDSFGTCFHPTGSRLNIRPTKLRLRLLSSGLTVLLTIVFRTCWSPPVFVSRRHAGLHQFLFLKTCWSPPVFKTFRSSSVLTHGSVFGIILLLFLAQLSGNLRTYSPTPAFLQST